MTVDLEIPPGRGVTVVKRVLLDILCVCREKPLKGWLDIWQLVWNSSGGANMKSQVDLRLGVKTENERTE
jgi:hypothetical protein